MSENKDVISDKTQEVDHENGEYKVTTRPNTSEETIKWDDVADVATGANSILHSTGMLYEGICDVFTKEIESSERATLYLNGIAKQIEALISTFNKLANGHTVVDPDGVKVYLTGLVDTSNEEHSKLAVALIIGYNDITDKANNVADVAIVDFLGSLGEEFSDSKGTMANINKYLELTKG